MGRKDDIVEGLPIAASGFHLDAETGPAHRCNWRAKSQVNALAGHRRGQAIDIGN